MKKRGMFQVKMFKGFRKQLKKLSNHVQNEPIPNIDIMEILTDRFVNCYSFFFETNNDFIDSLPINILEETDFRTISNEYLDDYIQATTKCKNWNQFINKAVEEYKEKEKERLKAYQM